MFSCVCSNIANSAHRNSPKLAQIICLRAILLPVEFQENRILGSNICALVPLQTTYLEIFSCVCSDISNLAHRNSPKLTQVIRIIDILLSGEFQENRISGSTDICLGTTPNHIFGDIFCVCSDIANLAHRNSPKLAQIIRHISYYL